MHSVARQKNTASSPSRDQYTSGDFSPLLGGVVSGMWCDRQAQSVLTFWVGGWRQYFSILCLCKTRLAAGGILFSSCPSVRPFVRLFKTTRYLDNDWTDFWPIGRIGPRGKDMKWSTLRVRRLKVRVTQGRRFGGVEGASFSISLVE